MLGLDWSLQNHARHLFPSMQHACSWAASLKDPRVEPEGDAWRGLRHRPPNVARSLAPYLSQSIPTPYSAACLAAVASNTASKAAWITSGPAPWRVASEDRIWR